MEEGTVVEDAVKTEVSENGCSLVVVNGEVEVQVEGTVATVVPKPKVLEMSCTTENMTEDGGKAVETYSSKLQESSKLNEEGIVVTEKQYEEHAIREKSVKTVEGEVASVSHILMKENETLHTTEHGTETAEYNANVTEKHRSSVSTIETIGDQQVTRVKSSEKTVSRNKTKVEEDGGEGADKAITHGTHSDEHSKEKVIEHNPDAATVVHRRTSTTKSERCETKIIGGSGEDIDLSQLEKHSRILQGEANTGALVDLGAMGESKLGSTVSEDGSTGQTSEGSSSALAHGLDQIDLSASSSSSSAEQTTSAVGVATATQEGSSSATQESSGSVSKMAEAQGTKSTTQMTTTDSMTSGVASEYQNITNSTVPETLPQSERFESDKVTTAKTSEINEQTINTTTMKQQNITSQSSKSSEMTSNFDESRVQLEDCSDVKPPTLPENVIPRQSVKSATPGRSMTPEKPNGSKTVEINLAEMARTNLEVLRNDQAKRKSKEREAAAPQVRGSSQSFSQHMESRSHHVQQQQQHASQYQSEVSRSAVTAQAHSAAGATGVAAGGGVSWARGTGERRRQEASMEAECEPASREESPQFMPRFAPNDRKSADDLVRRILAESRGEPCRPMSSAGSEGAPEKVRIDMGASAGDMEHTSSSASSHVMSESRSASSMDTSGGYKSAFLAEAESTLAEKAVGAERKREPAEGEADQPTMVERPLIGDKLGHLFTGEDLSRGGTSGRGVYASHEMYESKEVRRSKGSSLGSGAGPMGPSRGERDDFDDLDHEISAIRQQYKENQARRLQHYDDDSDAGSDNVGEFTHGYKGRARMLRQEYVDDTYGGAYGVDSPVPHEDDFIPDEDFEPQRREETAEVVKEKTVGIRSVINQQEEALHKLRRASESFDELQDEIKLIRQQCLENQNRRTSLMDEEDIETSAVSAPKPYVPGSYVRGSYLTNRKAGDLAITAGSSSYGGAGEQEERSSSRSYTLTRKTYGGYDEDDDSTYAAARDLRSKYGRSKSLYDTSSADSLYRSSASSYEAGEDGSTASSYSRPSYTPRTYGTSGTAGYSSDYSANRLSYTSRFSRGQDDSSVGTSSGYRPRYSRSFTLPDIESPYGSMPSSGSAFTSKFLQKVRERKVSGGGGGGGGGGMEESSEGKTRDKPFKSRFLRNTFDSDFKPAGSSSYSSRFSSSSSRVTKTTSSSSTSGSKSSESADGASDKQSTSSKRE